MAIQRSYLFVPGDRPDRFDKALSSPADVVIVDLEDAVPAANKSMARDALANWSSPEKKVLVRINAITTPWFAEDCRVARLAGVAGVILPKAEQLSDVDELAAASHAKPVFALIESAVGLANVRALAASDHVQCLVFGSIDLQADLGLSATEEELLPYRMELVLASKLAGIAAPIDGVSTAIDDLARLQADTLRARRLGFGGKLCIHPRQAAIVNQFYFPSEEEIAWATTVLRANDEAGGAAVALDGHMIDRPVVLRATRIVEAAGLR